jgi:hypothetical protein
VIFLILGVHIVADISGFLALIFISATALLMFVKKRIFSHTSKQSLVNKIHIGLAVLGGGFLLIHGDYFLHAPLTNFAVFLGYFSTGVALIVWFTGFSFLERMRYSLLYHGSLSLFAIALMVVHSFDLGFGIPLYVSELLLAVTAMVLFTRAIQHIVKILR